MLSPEAVLECTELSRKAEVLAKGGASDRSQAQVLQQRISTIQRSGLSSREAMEAYVSELNRRLNPPNTEGEKRYHSGFCRYIAGETDKQPELRDMISGAESITYSALAAGGALVPFAFDPVLRVVSRQVTPLLDEQISDFAEITGPFRPGQISGVDLSTVAAAIVAESAQQTSQTFPTLLGTVMKPNIIFRTTFVASLELEEDAENFALAIVKAAAVAHARAIGAQCVSSTSFTGALAQSAPASGVVTTTGVISLTAVESIFYSIDRYWRNSPKCAWLMSDSCWQRMRTTLVDSQNRPLLDLSEGDNVTLMGKPVLISPDLPNLATSNSQIYFGDFGAFRIRKSRMTIRRNTQLGSFGDVTKGEATFTSLCQADAMIFDPSSGSNPPITVSTVTK